MAHGYARYEARGSENGVRLSTACFPLGAGDGDGAAKKIFLFFLGVRKKAVMDARFGGH